MGISHPVSARGKSIPFVLSRPNLTNTTIEINSILDTLLPLFLLKCSTFLIIKALWQHRRSTFTSLACSSNPHRNYGSLSSHDTSDTAAMGSGSSERTAIHDDPLPKWTLYNMARITASILHVVIAGTALSRLARNDYAIDPVTEGPWKTLIITAFGAHGLFWVRVNYREKVVEISLFIYA